MIDWSSSKPEERCSPGGLTPSAQEKVSGESPQRKKREKDFVLSRTLNIFMGDKRQELGMKIGSHQRAQSFQFAHN